MDDHRSDRAIGIRSRVPGPSFVLYVVLAAAFTAAIIAYSRSYGRLLVGPLYDDVVYLDEGLRYVAVAQTEGAHALVSYMLQRPPHSPFSTLTAFLSFLLVGPAEWAPYAAMGVVVLAVVLAADQLMVGLPRHARVGAALFVLSFPIVGTLPYHFRPDATAGLATGLGAVMMLRYSPLWAPRAHQYWTGLCFAVSLCIKTPVAPFTLSMFLGSWLLSALAGRRDDLVAARHATMLEAPRARRGLWSATWPYLAPVLLVAGPYYAIAWRQIYRYVYDNVFGRNAEVWRLDRDWPSMARFVWDGEAGHLMLRRHGYLVVGLACVSGLVYALTAWRSRETTASWMRMVAAVIGILFLAWLFPTVSRYANPFTGSTFAAILLWVGVMLLRSLFIIDRTAEGKAGPSRLGTVLGWGAVGLAVLAFTWPDLVGTKQSDWVRIDNELERAVYRVIVDHTGGNSATVFVTNAANLSAHLLQFRARAEHAPLTVVGPSFSKSLDEYRARIASSDYVVSGDQGAFRENTSLPMYQLQDAVVADLKATPGLTLLTTIPGHLGRHVYVFGRQAAFGGWSNAEWLGYLEWFAPAGGKLVRWGLGPATRLTVMSAAARAGAVELTGLTMTAGQAVEVAVNGRAVGRLALEPPEGFKTLKLPVMWRAGENLVELRYATWVPQPGEAARAVLYKVLRVE